MVGLNEEEEKSATCKDSTFEFLLDCALEQANLGERYGNGLTTQGWKNAKEKFRKTTGLSYNELLQVKNKWVSIKERWERWYKIFGKDIGLGWNQEKDNVEASPDWWEKKILEEPEAAQFQKNGLKFAAKLTFLFVPSAVMGEHVHSCGSFPDVLFQDMEKIDTTEGAGDSEDPNFGGVHGDSNVDCSFEFEKITLNTSAGSGKKRKHNDYMGRFVETLESRTIDDVKNAELNNRYTITNVMKEVKKLPGMEPGSRLLTQCSHILENPISRQMFVALEDADSRLNYLLYKIKKKRS